MARWLALAAAALALAGCARHEISVDGAYVRLAAVSGQPAAAYFTLHGGAADATLVAVSSEKAIRAEMHQSMQGAGNMSSMQPLASVALPAHGTVAFQPGGRHVMLFGLGQSVTPGSRVQLLFTLADGTRYETYPPVISAGDPAP